MGIYSKEQQVRTVVNKKTGESKVFKSSGVDAKGLHYFTSSDSAKIEKFLTGKNPSAKTGLPTTTDKKGNILVAAGSVADDGMLAGMNVYVKGVEGDIPQ